MRTRAATTAVIVVLAVCLASGWPAAVSVAAAAPQLSANVTSGPPGTPVTLSGTGFCSSGCSTVTIEFNGFPADKGIQVAPDGSFQLSAGVSGSSGTVEILAIQQRTPPAQGTIQAFTYFTVTPGAPPNGSPSGPGPGSGATTTTVAPTTPTSPRTTPRGAVTTTSAVSTTTTRDGASSTTSTDRLGLAGPARPGSGGLPAGAIAGIIVAAIAVTAGLIYGIWRRRRHV